MTGDKFFEKRIVSDIAKGRYSSEQVQTVLREVFLAGREAGERDAFEYTVLADLQTLHYDFGFGAVRLKRFAEKQTAAIQAFDAKVFNAEDMRQALKDDAKFDYSVRWEE